MDAKLEKIKNYCAYQDRCHQEVRNKLLRMKVYGDELEEMMTMLIQENYLNEERFARSFARGKFRMNSWGKIKIKQGLQAKNISAYLIRKALEEIDEDVYQEVLQEMIKKEFVKLDGNISFAVKNKIVKTCMRRGFEYEEIKRAMDLLVR